MKKFLLLFLFAPLFSQAATTDTLVVKTKIYCDHCMECETCWPQIEKEVLYTKGVKYAWMDVASMTITVVYSSKKTNPDLIRQSISNAGYDADDLAANTEAKEKLDGCCKKR
jgi:periplasmic mercuric ion binding protein